jgi:hypothetical protein
MASPLLAKHGPREPVAFDRAPHAGVRTVSDLLADAARVAARLPPASPGSHVLLAIRGAPYTFVAALLGTWARGHAAALPPDAGRDWILRLAQRNDTVAVLHDTETDAPIRVDQVLAAGESIAPLRSVELPSVPVTFYANDHRAWPKRRSQLLAEAEQLARRLALPAGFRVASTVPASHQYGFTCGVLWPLIAGGVAVGVSDRPEVLVTVPAHLRGASLEGVRRVISSRGTLETALDVPLLEIFGSTATGAIGMREHLDRGFEPLSDVQLDLSREGELRARVPFADESHPTGELARLNDAGEFFPLGALHERGLPEIERTILAVSGVEDAIVVRSGEQLFAAVVCARAAEADVRAQLSASGLARLLLVPRVPRTSTGRPRRDRVLEQFACDASGNPLRFELAWDPSEPDAVQHDEPNRRVFHVHVPADYGHFAGHFAGYPILPGAAQLSELVLPCVRRARPELGRLEHMARVKFSARIQPDERIAVGLSWRAGERTLEFTLHRAETLCAAGRLTFATGGAP